MEHMEIVMKKSYFEEAMTLLLTTGSKARGIDGVGIQDIKPDVDEFVEEVYSKVLMNTYAPSAVKVVTIDQRNKKRQIGILTVEDRVVHGAVKLWLEDKITKPFYKHSYAYQEGKSAHQAVNQIEKWLSEGYQWIGETDISEFFDRIEHDKLAEQLRYFIGSNYGDMISFIVYLFSDREEGITQGSPLSPLLANIYLHYFDDYLDRQAYKYVRFSDDLLILSKTEQQIESGLTHITSALNMLGLEMNQEKTAIIHLEKGFDFLGFTFSKSGKQSSLKGINHLQNRLKDVIRSSGDVAEKMELVKDILVGWKQYYLKIPWSEFQQHDIFILEPSFEGNLNDGWYENVIAKLEGVESSGFIAFQLFSYSHSLERIQDSFWWSALYYQYAGKLEQNMIQLFREYGLNDQLEIEIIIKQMITYMEKSNKENGELLQETFIDKELFKLGRLFHALRYPLEQQSQLHSPNPIPNYERFMELFEGREDTFLEETFIDERRTFVPQGRAWNSEDVHQHFIGEKTIGQYVIRSNQTLKYAIIDIDICKSIIKTLDSEQSFAAYLNKAFKDAKKVLDTAKKLGLPAYLLESGYRGFHVWFFFSRLMPLDEIFQFVNVIIENTGMPSEGIAWERFPKQKKLKEGKLGQVIKLPFGKHSYTGEQAWFIDEQGEKITDQLSYLENMKTIHPEVIHKIINKKNQQVNEPLNEGKQPKAIQAILKGCSISAFIVNKAETTEYLSHQERLLLLNVFAPLGDEGKDFVRKVISRTYNYKEHVTNKFLSRAYSTPISCIRIREHFPALTTKLPCHCRFNESLGRYPTPVLHSSYQIATRKESVPESTGEQVSGRSMRDSEVDNIKRLNELTEKLIELRKHQRGLKKTVHRVESELDSIFEKMGVAEIEMELGKLVKRTENNQSSWVIHI